MLLLILCTVVGNLIVLRLTLKRSTLRLLSVLASADLLLGVSVLPISAAREILNFRLAWIVCASWNTLDVMCCTASIMTLAALGWERHAGVTAPLDTLARSKRTKILAGLIWPISLLVAIPTAFIPSPARRHDGVIEKVCSVNTNIGYVFFSITLSFYLPAVTLLVLYYRVIMVLRQLPPLRVHRGRSPDVQSIRRTPRLDLTPLKKVAEILKDKLFVSPMGHHLVCPEQTEKHRTNHNRSYLGDLLSPYKNNSENYSNNTSQSRQVRATRTIIFLMCLFLICWTPFFVMLPIDSLCDCVSSEIFTWTTWLGYANSAINPLVYLCTSNKVRRAFTNSNSQTSDTAIPIRVL